MLHQFTYRLFKLKLIQPSDNAIKYWLDTHAVNKLESHYYPPTAEQLIDGLNNITEHYERYICK